MLLLHLEKRPLREKSRFDGDTLFAATPATNTCSGKKPGFAGDSPLLLHCYTKYNYR